jgi:hypothetical protein
MDIGTLQSKVNQYNEILENTAKYRAAWPKKIKPLIKRTLRTIVHETGLKAEIDNKSEMENLEVVFLTLGKDYSGIAEKVENSNTKRNLIKSNGALVYQQLFNGKILVMIMYPHIEGYGQPRPPKNIEILRPHELTKGFIIRHAEEFLKEVISWEDFDDDDNPQKAPFNPIGFQTQIITEDDLEG